MKNKSRILQLAIVGFWLIFFQISCFAQEQIKSSTVDLYSRIKSLTGVYVKKIDPLPGFKEGFEIAVVQPVDHNNPSGAKFTL